MSHKYTINEMQTILYISMFYNNSLDLEYILKSKNCYPLSSKRCQIIFTQLIINILYTLSVSLTWTLNRDCIFKKFMDILNKRRIFKKNYLHFFEPIILPINIPSHLEEIKKFCILMQDHSYGMFLNPYLASLVWSYIDNHPCS